MDAIQNFVPHALCQLARVVTLNGIQKFYLRNFTGRDLVAQAVGHMILKSALRPWLGSNPNEVDAFSKFIKIIVNAHRDS